VAVQTRLATPAWADRIAAAGVATLLRPEPPPLRLAWVSSWDVPCGVAEYSRALVEAMRAIRDGRIADPVILPERRSTPRTEGPAVRPVWGIGDPTTIAPLARAIAQQDADAVVIQHQPGLMPWRMLADLLDDRRLAGRITVVALHAARQVLDIPQTERAGVVAALARATRVLAHRVSDVELLRELGVENNVTVFPQGAPPVASRPVIRVLAPADAPVIGCYGFFLPGKGIPRLMQAFAALRRQWPHAQLWLVNAEYPSPLSSQEIAACRALANSLGIADAIAWHTEFTAGDESLRRLAGCDLLVLSYDHSKESSSAALRGALASGVPLAVTPIALFDEADDAVHRFASLDPDAMTAGIDRLLREPETRTRLQATAATWMAARSWSSLARRLHGMLLGLRAQETLAPSADFIAPLPALPAPPPRAAAAASAMRSEPADPREALAATLDYVALTGDPPTPQAPPAVITRGSRLCRQGDFATDGFRFWMQAMHEPPAMRRKLWEWFFTADALYQRDMLRPGRSGVGFGVGQEPLPSLFARLGCEIVATDMAVEAAATAGWVNSGEHAHALTALNTRGICDPMQFAERVRFMVADMNAIPNELDGRFDFCWSSCAFEHLGSLEHGLRFVERAQRVLKPGGVAVHTTEFNMSSDDDTLERPELSLYRRRDLIALAARLSEHGDRVEPFDFNPGSGFADGFIDLPPYLRTPLHLRLRIGDYDCTSIGLIVHRGGAAVA
jgi:glycosyltransferase involved in cell wall biosynthesis/SAM-dependent methyltransferase